MHYEFLSSLNNVLLMSTGYLLLLALLPGIAIAAFIYLRDIREPEPYGLLLLTALYGAVGFFIARGISYLLHSFVHVGAEGIELVSAFVFMGLVIEGVKFLLMRGIIFYYKNFNQPFDGIVYAIMLGMGYATTENVLYVLNIGADVSMLRMWTTVPANAVFAVIMGFFLGEAKLFPNKVLMYSLLALLLAVIAHGFYNYFVQLENIPALRIQAIVSLVLIVVLVQFAYRQRKSAVIKVELSLIHI